MRNYRVFVSLPGKDFFKEVYDEAIRPAAQGKLETLSYHDLPKQGNFHERISSEIAYSNIVVCILSGGNANVLYEVGLALGYGKPIVVITDNVRTMPAMLASRTAITYKVRQPDWTKVTQELQTCYQDILHGGYSQLRVRSHTELLVSSEKSMGDHTGVTSDSDPLQAAIVSYNAKNYIGVITRLGSRDLKTLPGSEHAYFYLSDSYFLYAEALPEGGLKEANYRKMLEYSEEGHRLYPANKDIFKNLGLANLKLDRFDAAVEIFKQLIVEHPTYHVARYNLACIHARRGDIFRCIRELSMVIEQDQAYRVLARVDTDFDGLWQKDLFQRLIYPMSRTTVG